MNLLIYLTPFLLTIILIPQWIKFANKYNITDKPMLRKIHSIPVPMLGGIIICLSSAIAIVLFHVYDDNFILDKILIAYLISTLFLLILGIADDVKPVRAIYKLALQFIISFYFIYFSDIYLNLFIYNLNLMSISIILAFICVGVINSINLIDGIDGLAGGLSIISILGLIFVLENPVDITILIIITSSLIGFLLFNFNPAKIFMGDTGSYFLGFTLAVFCLRAHIEGTLKLPFSILIIGIPVLDLIRVSVYRFIKDRRMLVADQNHIHHLMLKMGNSQNNTVLILFTLQIMIVLTTITILI